MLQRRQHYKKWQLLLAVVGVVAVLAVCSLGSFLILKDEQQGTQAQANAASAVPSVVPRDISSREVDPAPLTEAEVFPGPQIEVVVGQPAYPVLKTQAAADCRVAAVDELAKLLGQVGCSQVVRATMRSAAGDYLLTAGIFNLATEEGAKQAKTGVRPLIDAQTGRFTGMVAGRGTEPIARSSTHMSWDARGHFLLYVVIARSDGKAFIPGDPVAKQILFDMIELHLHNVIERRAIVPASAAPGASPSAAG